MPACRFTGSPSTPGPILLTPMVRPTGRSRVRSARCSLGCGPGSCICTRAPPRFRRRWLDAAHAAGAKVVFTYHTPTVSCVRGTMMRMGRSACDGRLDRRRCSACVLAAHGMPPLLRDACGLHARGDRPAWSSASGSGRARRHRPAPAGLWSARRIGASASSMRKADRVVAVCLWARDVLRLNGVPDDKLVLCRQGLPRSGDPARRYIARPTATARHTAFCGSAISAGSIPPKGIDILIDALRRIPEVPLRLDIFAVRQAGSDAYASRLERRAAGDRRIVFRAALPPECGARGDARRATSSPCRRAGSKPGRLSCSKPSTRERRCSGRGLAASRNSSRTGSTGSSCPPKGRRPGPRRSSNSRIARPRSRDCEPASARRARSTRSRTRWRKFTARSGCDGSA